MGKLRHDSSSVTCVGSALESIKNASCWVFYPISETSRNFSRAISPAPHGPAWRSVSANIALPRCQMYSKRRKEKFTAPIAFSWLFIFFFKFTQGFSQLKCISYEFDFFCCCSVSASPAKTLLFMETATKIKKKRKTSKQKLLRLCFKNLPVPLRG